MLSEIVTPQVQLVILIIPMHMQDEIRHNMQYLPTAYVILTE